MIVLFINQNIYAVNTHKNHLNETPTNIAIDG